MSNLGPYKLDEIYTGDALVLSKPIPDHSIDLVFTDPPYLKEYLPLYEWLAKESARILKPSGFVLTYTGGYWKDEVMALLRQHLEYFWDFTLTMNDSPIMWPRKVIARSKSILAYRLFKSDALPRYNVLGHWTNSHMDKRFHKWGQNEETARYYIDCFTDVEDVVFDPFCGGGTTCAVCELLGRHFLAFEIDESTADDARNRLGGFTPMYQPALMTYEQTRLESCGE